MKKVIYITFALLFIVGCLSEEKINTSISVQVDLPSEFTSLVDMTKIEISLINTGNGVTYKTMCDATGEAVFNAEYGVYEATLQHKLAIDGIMNIFNGRLENIQIYPGESQQLSYSMSLTAAKSSQLIIKEFYYFGCIGSDNKNFNNDCYITIYNNSDEIAYLDDLCIGMVSPMTSASESKFKIDGELIDDVPLDQMAFAFPGGGTDNPLLPGEEVCIAYMGIDHKSLHPNSIDLSKADYAFYDQAFDMKVQQPALGVKHMIGMWRRAENAYAFPITTTAKAMIIFRVPGMKPLEYGSNPENAMTQPNSASTMLYLKVPHEWVLDGIECVTSAVQANKRLHSSVDAGFFYIEEGRGCGLAAIRKVDEIIDGRIVYMDTNNSTLDLEKGIPTRKDK